MEKGGDAAFVSELKLEKDAQKNWDRFYKRNSSNFFKDRNWTKKEIELLCGDVSLNENLLFLDAGCGCGNTIFPLTKSFPQWSFYGVDFSKNAISLLEKRAEELDVSVQVRVFDLTSENIQELNLPQMDIISLVFVLSTISKEGQKNVIKNIKKILKPGGSVIVRDYGAFDHAMTRFGRNSKIDERFYVRQDGTRAYYFLKEELISIFEEFGYSTSKCIYVHRTTENIKEGINFERTFVEGRFTLKTPKIT
uniref:tRNA N(3)-methylcytidine methyltransferase n=1 Tax=Meloidogyne hapla TaxID=6305 RepID=A0A1I8BS88_MELHA